MNIKNTLKKMTLCALVAGLSVSGCAIKKLSKNLYIEITGYEYLLFNKEYTGKIKPIPSNQNSNCYDYKIYGDENQDCVVPIIRFKYKF